MDSHAPAEENRRPPREAEQDDGRGDAADHRDQPARGEIHRRRERRPRHPEVEVARDGEVARQLRILEVSHARRTHAGLGQPIVEPGGRAVAEVGAGRRVQRPQHLQQHEQHAHQGERPGQAAALLHDGDEPAHRNREGRRQHAAEHEQHPPEDGQRRVRLRQHREELPLVALAQSCQHSAKTYYTDDGPAIADCMRRSDILTAPTLPDTTSRPWLAYASLVVAVLGITWSAVFVRWAGVSGPASAFYRVLVAAAVLLPWRVLRRDLAPRRAGRPGWRWRAARSSGSTCCSSTRPCSARRRRRPCCSATTRRSSSGWARGCSSTSGRARRSGGDWRWP